jgi:hypothetical protein
MGVATEKLLASVGAVAVVASFAGRTGLTGQRASWFVLMAM